MDEKQPNHSWFWKMLLNSKTINSLVIILLVLLIVLVYTKISFVFNPIWQILGLVGLPIIIAGILFYILNPVVDWISNKLNCHRITVISVIFLILTILIGWAFLSIIPMIRNEWYELVNSWPGYLKKIDAAVKTLTTKPEVSSLNKRFNIIDGKNHSSDYINQLLQTTTNSFNNILSKVAYILVSIITAPIILFYLLKDSHRFAGYVLHFFPNKSRPEFGKILHEINTQISNYIRGKILVAFGAFVVYLVGYSLIGLNYALLVAAVAGLMTFVPYLGSIIALIPVIMISYFASVGMVFKVLVVYFVEQFIEGRILTPMVIGNTMKIYPITILVIVITCGKLFGLMGIILGVPAYAAFKVVFQEFFAWYRQKSGLY